MCLVITRDVGDRKKGRFEVFWCTQTDKQKHNPDKKP